MAVKNCLIRGSVVRYVQLRAEHVDTQLLEDATRRGKAPFHLHNQIQVLCSRGRMTPNLDCAVGAGGDQFPSVRGMMFYPCYDFMVYLRRRFWFERFCLRQEELRSDVIGVHKDERTHIKKVPGPNGTIFISCNKRRRWLRRVQNRRDNSMKSGRGRKNH